MAQTSYGSITIVDTTDIQRFYVQYAKSNNSANAPSSGWSQAMPTWENGTYIWQRTVAKRQGVALSASDYGNPVCITGSKGQTGQTGSTGKGISSIVTTYCNYGTGTPAASYSGWGTNVPTYDKNKPNYWVKTVVNYTSGNPSTTIYKDLGITEAAQKANLAASLAQTAQAHSAEAISIAGSKNKIYYANNFTPAGSDGAYLNGDTLFYKTDNGTVMYVYDDSYTNASSGHWRQQQFEENAISDLAITNAKIKNLSGDKIIANTITATQIYSHTITSAELATNAIQSNNYRAGVATEPYSAAGTFLDLAQGNIYTPNFGVNNDVTDNITDGAYIRGSIYAHTGTIGQSNTNYWYIGNYSDYNQAQSALIKGYGTATIQLGNNSTWRLNTNRIHTAWYDSNSNDLMLHYPSFNSKYQDLGFHVPTSVSDKFIYIRESKNNISTEDILENLLGNINDNLDGTNNYWNYKFFINADGSLYARNIYALDDSGNYTLISGANGAYLLKSGGTIQNNLVINGTLQVKENYLNKNGSALTLQTNLGSTTAGTLTGNTSSAISIGVTGTLPSSNGGTGNTNWNQGGVVYIDGSSPKKLLSTAAGTSGYLLKSNGTGAPTWINPATLTVAAATKATQDGDGNVIKTTYLKLSGGNVTGPVNFGDSVSVDDLNAGTLVVTGNASFTNNIQVNTINGVAVGSSPKFTDTVTTVTTSGNGNAVTAITASGGKLTVTKGTTFLTSFTQSDPVFTASVAASIKQTDIDNWNSKTSNTGTVKSVAASGSGGITISGSPITVSGTLTIGLNLSTAINGLGEGTSAANRNDYAVVQYAGGGTTTTSYHRRKLSNVFAALNSSDITTALGFTPYNATNPNGYTSNPGTVTSVRVQASSPLQSSTSTVQSSSLNTTISFVNQNANVVLAGPSSGNAAAPAFRALVAADIPSLTKSKISDFPTTWALSSVTGADDLKAIEVLEGTSGLLKKTGANTWQLDTNTYVTSSGVTSITLTQGTGISIGSSGTAIISTGTRTISLANNYGDTKNPYASKTARYVLAAPAAAAGVPTFRALTKDDVGLNNILNIKQVTGIGQGENGKIRVFKGSGTNDYEDIAVEIVATSTSSVASSQKLTSYGGSATQPVYFPADGANAGKPIAISYTIEKSVPSNAVFTDTWNKVSTSQDGYITKLPGNTTTFLRGDGTWGTPEGTYSLPLAANGTRGGVQIGYSSSGKNYAVQLSSQKMYVNVPWTDTTYSAGTGLSLSGTTFNHSNSVTAGTVGTSSATNGATLAVPYITYDAQGHVTNSGTHTHTINNIPQADVTWGGPALSGSVSPNEVATIDDLAHNKFAFMSAASVAVHYSRDGGSTWVSYGTNEDHRKLVTLSSSFQIGGPQAGKSATVNDQLRVQLNSNRAGGNIYCNLRRILIYLGTNGSTGSTCTVQYKTIANYNNNNDTWTTAGTYNVSGWSGWNSIPFSGSFGGSSTQTGQIAQIRLIFKVTGVSSSYTNLTISSIQGIAFPLWNSPSTMASTGHLYTFDINQNATFPAQVTATQFNGPLNGNATTASWVDLLKPINTTTTASASTWSIPSGSKQVWGERFSDSTLTYTPSGGSATAITDTGDWVIWLTPNATANNATLNMKIDGTYYGSFNGNLSGNASTATEFSSNATVTLTGDTTGTSAGSKKSWSVATTTSQITSNELTNQDLNNYKTLSKVLFYYGGGSNTVSNKPSGINQFGVFTYNTAAGHVTQELSANNRKWIRFWNNSTWSSWQKFVTDSNYTDYTVTKTGTGASGDWDISITGNAATASRLKQNTEMTYGWSGINYFNISAANQSAAKVNDTPFSSATWTHILRFNHANNSGYYTDLAVPFNANSLYYKRITSGSLQNTSTNGGWVKILDQLNYTDYTVKKDGTGASGSWGISVTGTASNVTGTVAIANGGTGKTTTVDAINNLLGGLPVWSANPSDSTYFIRQDTGGTASYGKVPFSTLWNYIKSKSDSTYVTLDTVQTISGTKTFTGGVSMKSSTTTNACNINYNTSLNALVFSFV